MWDSVDYLTPNVVSGLLTTPRQICATFRCRSKIPHWRGRNPNKEVLIPDIILDFLKKPMKFKENLVRGSGPSHSISH